MSLLTLSVLPIPGRFPGLEEDPFFFFEGIEQLELMNRVRTMLRLFLRARWGQSRCAHCSLLSTQRLSDIQPRISPYVDPFLQVISPEAFQTFELKWWNSRSQNREADDRRTFEHYMRWWFDNDRWWWWWWHSILGKEPYVGMWEEDWKKEGRVKEHMYE